MTNRGNHIMDYGTDSDDWEKREFVFEYKTQIYAHRWWNFGENPPMGYLHLVAQYIVNHPEEFKGAGPQ